MKQTSFSLLRTTINGCILMTASILFASLFPNSIFREGFGLLAGIALVPLAILLQRINWYVVPLWGFAYGFLSYGLFNIWLITFSPASFFVVPTIYGIYFMFVCLALKLIQMYFRNYAFLVQAMLWLIYEYLRISGFLGYSFGVLGYALAFHPLLIQTSDIFGVWGITFYLVCMSFFLAQLHYDVHNTISEQHNNQTSHTIMNSIKIYFKQSIHISKRRHYRIFLILYGSITIFGLGYGLLATVDYSNNETVRTALMQHATDPWEGGNNAYRTSLDILKIQTKAAMETEPPPDLVVWSETAFVPSISYHLKYREVPEYTRLIQELLDFLALYPNTNYIIGNGEGIKIKNDEGHLVRSDYNATLLFEGDKILDTYYKMHLVPFTEYFPYKKLFPRFYQYLVNSDVHFWIHGTEHTVLHTNEVAISTPICFEDGFGLQNAKFVRAGAEILVNVSNDAWSHVESNAMQHLQLSILRAVENRRSVARSTNSGMTGVIDPNGKILSMLSSFSKEYLLYDVPIFTQKNTIYTRWGDWFIGFVLILLIFSILYLTWKHIHESHTPIP